MKDTIPALGAMRYHDNVSLKARKGWRGTGDGKKREKANCII